MDLEAVMTQLKSLGTAQNVKTYQRHGAGNNVFGVSFSDLKKLSRKIGTNHELAMQLWETGNSDARSLSMLLADPDDVTPTLATQWMKDVNYYLHGNEVASVVARSSSGLSKMRQWRKQKSEYARATGYAILCSMLKDDPDAVENDECRRIMKDVELEIHRSPNRARHAMVMAVIAIGVFKRELSEEAIETGQRIGDVDVDHGETDCSTPKIAAYINRALSRSERSRKVATGR